LAFPKNGQDTVLEAVPKSTKRALERARLVGLASLPIVTDLPKKAEAFREGRGFVAPRTAGPRRT